MGPTEALIEFFIDAKASYAIILTADAMVLRRLSDSSELAKTVNAHLDAIANRKPIDVTGRRLYSLLIQPIAGDIASKKNLIISPDGDLHRLPFETLVDGSGRMLLEGHVVSYTPSATVLALLRHPTGLRNPFFLCSR